MNRDRLIPDFSDISPIHFSTSEGQTKEDRFQSRGFLCRWKLFESGQSFVFESNFHRL